MENVADALHIAFAVLVFALATFLAFATFSQAREVADVVLYTNDKTNFDEHVEGSTINRIVGLETIIPAIRGYIADNEGYAIILKDEKKNREYTFDIKEQAYQLKDYLISGTTDKAQLNGRTIRVNQIISSPGDLTAYLKDALQEITKLYNDNKDVKFEETYEEVVISGGKVQGADGEEVDKIYFNEIDGVVIERINTNTKVIITYTRK